MRWVGVGLAAVVLGVACAPQGIGEGGTATTDATVAGPAPEVYVAIGGADALGLGADRPLAEAWPRQVMRALPSGAVFVNAGTAPATVADVRQQQLPLALEVEASLVTVWLHRDDIANGTPVAAYERQLRELVRELQQGGEVRVLLGNALPIEELPAHPSLFARRAGRVPSTEEVADLVAEYNAAIARVAATEGAELVDVHHAASEAVTNGSFVLWVAEDGLNPSTLGHNRIAELFIAGL